MSQCAVLDVLRGPYRDAVLENRFDEAARIYDAEVGLDCEYIGATGSRRRTSISDGSVIIAEYMCAMDGQERCNGTVLVESAGSRIEWLRWVDVTALSKRKEQK